MDSKFGKVALRGEDRGKAVVDPEFKNSLIAFQMQLTKCFKE